MSRLEGWHLAGSAWQRRGRTPRLFDPDFELGLTEPVAANSGSRVALADVDHVIHGDLTTIPEWAEWVGGVPVLESFVVHGQISLRAPRVICRDFWVLGRPGEFTYIESTNNAIMDHLYEFGTIAPTITDERNCGFKGGNATVRRMDVSNCTDAWQSFGNPGVYKHFIAHGNYIHDLVELPSTIQSDGINHMDGHQSFGMLSTVEDVGNSVGSVTGGAPRSRPNTSCVLLQKSRGTYLHPIRITDNWWYGHSTKGASFHMSTTMPGNVTEHYSRGGLLVHRNRLDRDSRHPRILARFGSRFAENFGMVGEDNPTNPNVWDPGPNSNVYMDDGSPVVVSPG